jgi:hypothetical protein
MFGKRPAAERGAFFVLEAGTEEEKERTGPEAGHYEG